MMNSLQENQGQDDNPNYDGALVPTPSSEENGKNDVMTSYQHTSSHRNQIPHIHLHLSNISYKQPIPSSSSSSTKSTTSSNRYKYILQNINPPPIEPYTLQAWMGPSGSGKSTLLKIASGHDDIDWNYLDSNSVMQINHESILHHHDVAGSDSNKHSITSTTKKPGVLMNSLNTMNSMIANTTNSTTKLNYPKSLVGVVWQDDLLLSQLTIRETVEFAAKLKTPIHDATHGTIKSLVDTTLKDLGLWSIQHSLIGPSSSSSSFSSSSWLRRTNRKKKKDDGDNTESTNQKSTTPTILLQNKQGISGGERKRVSIAQELVTRPPLLFLDEPTSGLDSTSALSLMRMLQSLAKNGGHSIVTVLHQPRTTIFEECLDNLLLISEGLEVYSGPVWNVQSVLESCVYVPRLPQRTNVADWILDVIREDEHGKLTKECNDIACAIDDESGSGEQLDSTKRVLPQHWTSYKDDTEEGQLIQTESGKQLTNSAFNATTNSENQSERPNHRLSSLIELRTNLPRYNVNFYTQFKLLTQRSMKQKRGEKITKASIIVTSSYILFESIFWFRLPDNTQFIYNRTSLIFFMIIAQVNGIVASSITTFKVESTLLNRERNKKMYRILPYYLSKTVADMTSGVLLPFFHSFIVYWICNLRANPASAFFIFLVIYYLILTTAQSLGLLMSIGIKNLQVALLVTPAITIFFMIVGGFYVPLSSMPNWISWSKWLSYGTYGYAGLVVNEFKGKIVPCSSDEIVVGCPLKGGDILDELGITGSLGAIWFNVLVLICMQLCFRFGAYLLLRRS